MSVRRWRAAASAVILMLALAGVPGCGGRRTDNATDTGKQVSCHVSRQTRIGLATGNSTGNSTGVYYTLGNAYAEQVSAATGGTVKVTAAETGASVQNIQQLVAGQYHVAFSLFDTATDAVNGAGAFPSKQPVEALARIYNNYTHLVVRRDAGIRSAADMAGKRISTGSPKSGTEVIANRLLQSAGLDPDKDIKRQRLDLTKSVDGMKDGTVDGLVWSGGLPTPGITDLFTTSGGTVTFLDITPLLPKMQAINVAYQRSTIPAATYRTAADVPTIAVPNVLLVRNDLDADTACVLTRTLVEKKDQLVKANAAAAGIDLRTVRKTEPVPLHRGAAAALDALGAD